MLKIIDCHTHINSSFFKESRDEVIERSLDNGVGMINIGTNLKDSIENIEIAKKYEGVWAAVAQHPTEKDEFSYDLFKKIAEEKEVVVIGECGLDYFRVDGVEMVVELEKKRQRDIFLQHIALAKEVSKPLMLHLRTSESYDDAISILQEETDLDKVIFHFFVGSEDQLERINKLPFKTYFTFGGVITFTSDYDQVINKVSLNRIMLETDAPFLSPVPYRGKQNEPSYIMETAKKMAVLKGISEEELFNQLKMNVKTVFNIDF